MLEITQKTLSFDVAFARYESIRDRLPDALSETGPKNATGLLALAEHYDGFLFDSFGVLNVGDTAIEGAAKVLLELRNRNKPFCVLTNAASYTSADAFDKYQRLGLDIRLNEILSSRDVLFRHVQGLESDHFWAAIAADDDGFADTSCRVVNLEQDVADWGNPDGFLFLSAARWTQAQQDRLVRALKARPRPVLVGNPDLVAPRQTGLTVEPGYWAHDIQDRCGIRVQFFGKPFTEAFEQAAARMPSRKLAMVGDTLHTDILGGQASRFDTILVSDHGLFTGRDVAGFIEKSGIIPSWIIPSV